MAQDHGLCRKRKESKREPAHGPPLQARVAAANGTVRTTFSTILVHMDRDWWGHSKMNGAN